MYSVDGPGIAVVPIVRTSSTPVVSHRVVRLVLENGAVLEISPGHPTADGRPFSALTAGDRLDATHLIVRTEIVAYRYDRTHDILPDSTSGAYFAAGALIGSTLAR